MARNGRFAPADNRELPTRITHIPGPVINVRDPQFRAPADGVTDARAALAAADVVAAAADEYLFVPPGAYRVGSNLTLSANVQFSPGARIRPDDGVTVTIAGTVQAGGYEIFERESDGTGVVKLAAGTPYNVAWFLEGDGRINERWDFLRAGLETNHHHEVWVMPPYPNQPGAYNMTGNTWAWELDAPLVFDDAENFCHWHQYARIKAVATVSRMMHFSPASKIENFHFTNGVQLYSDPPSGTPHATDGILIEGAARITNQGVIEINRCTRGINITSDTAPATQIHLGDVHIGHFHASGILVDGTSAVNGIAEVTINELVGQAYQGTASTGSLLHVRGVVRHFVCHNVAYRADVGNKIKNVVLVATTAAGTPGNGCVIGNIFSDGSADVGFAMEDGTGGSATKFSGWTVRGCHVGAETAYNVAFADGHNHFHISHSGGDIQLAGDCRNVTFTAPNGYNEAGSTIAANTRTGINNVFAAAAGAPSGTTPNAALYPPGCLFYNTSNGEVFLRRVDSVAWVRIA